MPKRTSLISLVAISAIYSLLSAAPPPDDEDLYLIELDGFQVFSKSMKLIDGFTGEEYAGNNDVVLGFRTEFNEILKKYHKRLLLVEAQNLKVRGESIKPFSNDLAELASSFGITDFTLKGPFLTRELSIFRRMVKDPFFNIEELVVWDLARLKLIGENLPNSKYSKNIRYNPETQQWERRVITKWEVSWITPDKNRRQIYKFKEQGLNLDTHKGFHLIDGGLRPDVPSEAFQEVKLYYPIFYNTGESTDSQIQSLSKNFLQNLYYIYDPYSWAARGNTRFRGGFSKQLEQHIKDQKLPVQNRDWLERVLANFLNDIITIKYWGADDIYDLQMLNASNKNKNQLGEDLDLLNWYPKEKRSVAYDPNQPVKIPSISFENPNRARYILLDAYRRYKEKFVDALRQRILVMDKDTDAKQLVKDALEEASGVPVDKYISAAIKAQESELKRFLKSL